MIWKIRRNLALVGLGFGSFAAAAVLSPSQLSFIDYDFGGACTMATESNWDFSGNPLALQKTQGAGAYLYSHAKCEEWNPEFANNSFRCCANFVPGRAARRKKLNRCAPERRGFSFCGEMTAAQRNYTADVESGRIPDVLKQIFDHYGAAGEQAHCSVNNGFLVHGRRLVPTERNRVAIRSPQRCVDFGTDAMIGVLEWLGRQVGQRYSTPEFAGVRMIVGDISAPRGGCLSGRGGRRGHASHTNGLDADVGFLVAKPNRASPVDLHRDFDPAVNWWFVKQILANPFACVKVIFLDKKLIQKLSKAARGDSDWPKLSRYLRHMPFHRNHFHVRVGLLPGGPGTWGCGGIPELEEEEVMPEGGEPGENDELSDEGVEDESGDEGDSVSDDDGNGTSSAKPVPTRTALPAMADDDDPSSVDNLKRKIKLPPVPAWVPYPSER